MTSKDAEDLYEAHIDIAHSEQRHTDLANRVNAIQAKNDEFASHSDTVEANMENQNRQHGGRNVEWIVASQQAPTKARQSEQQRACVADRLNTSQVGQVTCSIGWMRAKSGTKRGPFRSLGEISIMAALITAGCRVPESRWSTVLTTLPEVRVYGMIACFREEMPGPYTGRHAH